MIKSICKLWLLLTFAPGLLIALFCQDAHAQKIREPVRAGSFYPADPSELKRLIDQLTRKAQASNIQIPPDKNLRALLLPHAGYVYSGWTAAHASLVLNTGQFSKVIILGPDHFIGLNTAAISDVSAYRTPLGSIPLHTDTQKLRRFAHLFQPLPIAFDKEHSLEVVLPFLQSYLGEFQLVPIVVGAADPDRISNALDVLIEHDTLVVVSSDLSHFLSYSEAITRDGETIRRILNLEPGQFYQADNRACGVMPIRILLGLARRRHWQPVLLHYANSGDTAGDRSRVVGYAAIAFFGDLTMENKQSSNPDFNAAHGQVLVKLARHTIMERLGRSLPSSEVNLLKMAMQDKNFQSHCGTFVTLKIQGQLRGCIGNLTPAESIANGIKRNAINAAFHDPRFAPLSTDELEQTEIEVSILTEPHPLEYRDSDDLIDKLRVNIDGVIIRKGHASATFLPQVWEQLPKPEDFLTHLCMKAGLPSDAWKSSQLEILTYQVQYFAETR
jgi:AmmeMemoRadiSam system protein B/AmmeMemoRadiSam system protein A